MDISNDLFKRFGRSRGIFHSDPICLNSIKKCPVGLQARSRPGLPLDIHSIATELLIHAGRLSYNARGVEVAQEILKHFLRPLQTSNVLHLTDYIHIFYVMNDMIATPSCMLLQESIHHNFLMRPIANMNAFEAIINLQHRKTHQFLHAVLIDCGFAVWSPQQETALQPQQQRWDCLAVQWVA